MRGLVKLSERTDSQYTSAGRPPSLKRWNDNQLFSFPTAFWTKSGSPSFGA